MVQHTCQFDGFSHDDPNEDISSFLEICDTQKINGVSLEVIKLKLFSFFLKHKVKTWFNSSPKNTIATWDEMANKFLTKYFPPSKAKKLRGDLTTFTQLEFESIYETWERYKGLIRKVPHHRLPAWLEIQFFYNGLNPNTKMIIDATAGGALVGKERDEAYELLEEMASNSYQWQSDRAMPRKAVGVHEIDAISAIHANLHC